MEWSNLILNEETLEQINQLRLWIKHYETLRTNLKMEKRIAPGYRALFCGPVVQERH